MKKTDREEGLRWLEQAEADFKGASVLFDNHIYHLTCFISQQTAEKALKAYLYFRGEDIVTGHSVAALCSWCGEHNKDFSSIRDEIAILDGYYIPTRYPNGLPDGIPANIYTRKPAAEALSLAKLVIDFVKERIK